MFGSVSNSTASVTSGPTPSRAGFAYAHVLGNYLAQYQRCFDEGVFENYHGQLLDFVNRTLNEDLDFYKKLLTDDLTSYQYKFCQFIQSIQREVGASYQEKFALHKNIIEQLRVLICQSLMCKEENLEKNDLSTKCRQFINKLCVWMYLEVNVDNSLFQFIEKYALSVDELPFCDYSKLLLDVYEKVEQDLVFKGSYALREQYQDGPKLGQLAYKLFTSSLSNTQFFYSTNMLVDCSHFDEFTDSYKWVAEIIPEFLNYLLALKAEQHAHLQVVLMCRRLNTEALFTDTFEQLDCSSSVQESLYVILLDKNSDFYWQNKEFGQDRLSFDSFRTNFMGRLFENSSISYFYWSSKLDLEEWISTCSDIIDEVHKEYFSEQEILLREDRRAFIDLVYVRMIEKLCEQFKMKSASINCRHSADRTPTLWTLLSMNEMIRTQSHLNEQAEVKVVSSAFAPAMLYHNRVPVRVFVERTALTLTYMSRNLARLVTQTD